MTPYITKSDIKNEMQCSKLAYYKKFKPELVPNVDPFVKLLGERGNVVGEYAQTHFNPEESILLFKEGDTNEEVLLKTELALKNPKYKHLFEAAFLVDGVYVRCDIVTKTNSGWEIIEVKSGSSLDSEYQLDATIQYQVVKKALDISNLHVWYINKECPLPDVTNLFVKASVLEYTEEYTTKIESAITRLKSLLATPDCPQIDIGEHCNKPNACPLKGMCFQQERKIPELSVFDVPRIGRKAFDYYRKGITDIKDLNPEDFTEAQARMIKQTQDHKLHVDVKGIQEELKLWEFPLYNLDFEAMEYPLPGLPGTVPGVQVPFQFSLHVIYEPGGEIIKLAEYLHPDGTDPRLPLIAAMQKYVGPKGSIVAFSKSFEKSKLEKILKAFPTHAELHNSIVDWCGRFVDPLPLFRNFVYHPDFQGSFSIKYVGPALIGDAASYDDLDVKDGTGAVIAYQKMINPATQPEEKQKLFLSLLRYCDKDTWVMAALVVWLYQQAGMWK